MAVLAALILQVPLLADIVHLKSGGKIEGRVVEKGGQYEIQTAGGSVRVTKEDVVRIEKKEWSPPRTPGTRPAPVRLGASYGHPFYAFKLRLPSRWEFRKSEGRAAASFVGPKDQFYIPRMDLHLEKNPKELGDLVAAYKEAFKKAFGDVTYAFEEVTVVGGQTAYQMSVLFTEGEIPQQSLWTFIAQGERKYVLSFNCTRAWFERYRPVMDASMRTLRILPEPTAGPEEKRKFIEHYTKAESAYRAGRLADALADFEEAARLLPGFVDIHSALGTIHQKQNRFTDAEAAYRKAAELDPEDPAHAYNLGVCLLRQSKADPAIVSLRKAVELDPAMEAALTNLGVAYLMKELDDPARETLEKAVALDPESAPAHYNLGLAYERLKRPRDAEREFRQALSADPRHEEAKKSLERVRGSK